MSITEESITTKAPNGLAEIQSAPFELDLSGGACAPTSSPVSG